MRSRRFVLLLATLVFGASDLVYKSLDRAEFHHARAPLFTIVMTVVIVALVVLVPRVPSNAAAVGAGIACGGALGNLVSLLAWSQGVPDPLVFGGETRGVAFNLADVFALTGDGLLLSAVAVYGVRNRRALREPV